MSLRSPSTPGGGWSYGRAIVLASVLCMVVVGLFSGEVRHPFIIGPALGTIVGLGFIWGIPILFAFLLELKEPEETCPCHWCGRSVPRSGIMRVMTSSDPRSNGTEVCKGCFDEKILSERWAHLPGIKWFDKG